MLPHQVHIIDHPVIADKLTRLRQGVNAPRSFRELLYDLAVMVGYEATKSLDTEEIIVDMSSGPVTCKRIVSEVALVPILRSGLGMVEGVAQLVPFASVWHIGLYRDKLTTKPQTYYSNLPDVVSSKTCLILDPMLATGGSAVAVAKMLKQRGASNMKFLGLIGVLEGIEHLVSEYPEIQIYLAALDAGLDAKARIVPGFSGDSGDRQFGT